MKSKSLKKPKDCSRCTREGEEFRCFRKRFILDVDMARDFVADGREKVELEPDDIRYSIDHCEINARHLHHVDPRFPGIVAHLYYPDDDGTIIHCHRLIDGHHRASVCLLRDEPFYVYVLSEHESIQCLIRFPKGASPDELSEYLAEVTSIA